jgi:AbrB family looped-hinge helix DNA binding protein
MCCTSVKVTKRSIAYCSERKLFRVTIPKNIRDRFGLGPEAHVEFQIVGGAIVLKKAPKKLDLRKWKGRCSGSLEELGYASVDSFLDDVRG